MVLQLSSITVVADGREIVSGVDLAVGAGQIVGVLGPNGAGKSTLLRVAIGLVRPARGTVRLVGSELARLGRRAVARRAALVPQDAPVEFAFSVRELVAMGRYPHRGRLRPHTPLDLEVVERSMEKADVRALADRTVDTLSGGERRLAVFARALAQEAPLVVADEPTAGLDLAHRKILLDRLDEHARGERAALVAFHDLEEARAVCDRVVLLDRGRVVARGSPGEVLTEDRIREVYRATVSEVVARRRG